MNADDRATSSTGSTFTPRPEAGSAPVTGSQPQRASLRPITGEAPTTAPHAASAAPSPYAPVSGQQPSASSAAAPVARTTGSPFAPVSTPAPASAPEATSAPEPATSSSPSHAARSTMGDHQAFIGGAAAGVGATVGAGFDKLKGFALKAKDDLTAGDDIAASERRGGPRKARVLLSRLDPWSALKMGFLLSIALGIMVVVATYVVWSVLDSLQFFALADEWVQELFTTQTVDILPFFDLDKWMAAATLVAVVNVVLLTALSTLGALLYNTVSKVVGGVYVTLTDD